MNELNKEITALLAEANSGKLDRTVLHITQPHVCQSNAGFYIGRWCIEFECEQWLPQPYDRLSPYGTEDAITKSLPDFRKNH